MKGTVKNTRTKGEVSGSNEIRLTLGLDWQAHAHKTEWEAVSC